MSKRVSHRDKFDLLVQAVEAGNPEDLKKCIDSIGSLRDVNSSEETYLHLAAIENRLEVARFLVEACPDLLEARNIHGRTPWHVATILGHERIKKVLGHSTRADTSRTANKKGNTPESLTATEPTENTAELPKKTAQITISDKQTDITKDYISSASRHLPSLENLLSNAGNRLPALFVEFSKTYRSLPVECRNFLYKEYGFSPSPRADAKKVERLEQIVEFSKQRDIRDENYWAKLFYQAVAAGQFSELYSVLIKDKAKLTPEMLLYRPKSAASLFGGSKEPSMIELLMQQGQLPIIFTDVFFKHAFGQEAPVQLRAFNKLLDALPNPIVANQVGTATLRDFASHLGQEAVASVDALAKDSMAIHASTIAKEKIAAIEAGLAQVEASAGVTYDPATEQYSHLEKSDTSFSPHSRVEEDGKVVLVAPVNTIQGGALLSSYGHVCDTELDAQIYAMYAQQLEAIDRQTSTWFVPEGRANLNPLREHLLRTQAQGSPLHQLASQPAIEPTWSKRVETSGTALSPVKGG